MYCARSARQHFLCKRGIVRAGNQRFGAGIRRNARRRRALHAPRVAIRAAGAAAPLAPRSLGRRAVCAARRWTEARCFASPQGPARCGTRLVVIVQPDDGADAPEARVLAPARRGHVAPDGAAGSAHISQQQRNAGGVEGGLVAVVHHHRRLAGQRLAGRHHARARHAKGKVKRGGNGRQRQADCAPKELVRNQRLARRRRGCPVLPRRIARGGRHRQHGAQERSSVAGRRGCAARISRRVVSGAGSWRAHAQRRHAHTCRHHGHGRR